MSKAKGKGGTGRGTDKKGWNRWQVGANKAKKKPYISVGDKKANANVSNSNKGDKSEK